jgi:hypothetical protein
MAGCAADVNDPLPPPPAVEEQRAPPSEEHIAPLVDPYAALLHAIKVDHNLDDVPARQVHSGPYPPPER